MKKSRLLGAVCTCLLVIASTPIFGSVIYSYTGNPFDSFSVPTSYTSEMAITATIELATPLDMFNASVSPLSYSISDGINTITQDTGNDEIFSFRTDANGHIIDWAVSISIDPGLTSAGDTSLLLVTVAWPDSGDFLDFGRTITCTKAPCIFAGGSYFEDKGGNINQPGNWTVVDVSAVPIPSAVWLFGSGLIGLIGFARRKA